MGDRVLSRDKFGNLTFSPVYAFPHFVTDGDFRFVTIATALGNAVSATPDHYIFLSGKKQGAGGSTECSGAWGDRLAVAAAAVQAGDCVWAMDDTTGLPRLDRVVSTEAVSKRGIINPLTLTGTIVVDGVVSSVYNTMLGSEQVMHSVCGLGRWLWSSAPGGRWLAKGLHAVGIAPKLSLGIGYSVRLAIDALK